jgi:hypothetical protein
MKLQLITLSSLPPTVAELLDVHFKKHDISLYPALDPNICG